MTTSNGTHATQAGGPAPLVIVEHGDPSEEELAALTSVIAALQAEAKHASPRVSPAWTDRRRLVRQPLHPGPGQWRAQSAPR